MGKGQVSHWLVVLHGCLLRKKVTFIYNFRVTYFIGGKGYFYE